MDLNMTAKSRILTDPIEREADCGNIKALLDEYSPADQALIRDYASREIHRGLSQPDIFLIRQCRKILETN